MMTAGRKRQARDMRKREWVNWANIEIESPD